VVAPRLLVAPGYYRAGLEPQEIDPPDIRVDMGDRFITGSGELLPGELRSCYDAGAAQYEYSQYSQKYHCPQMFSLHVLPP